MLVLLSFCRSASFLNEITTLGSVLQFWSGQSDICVIQVALNKNEQFPTVTVLHHIPN
jgi:hypothetical protein